MPDFGTLQIRSIIVHEVPSRKVGSQDSQPVLSDIESVLNADLKNYFKERIVTGLVSGSFGVRFSTGTESPVPDLVGDLLETDPDLVGASQSMANHLFQSQDGSNSEGLLIVAAGTVGGAQMVAILKLEKEVGVRVRQTTVNGRRTFDLQHLSDLMLTPHTRVYKIAAFVATADEDEPPSGTVTDKQRGFHPSTEVAHFFLTRFLGCELLEAPDVSTKRFFTAVQDFINDEVDDASLRARYEIGLLAEVSSANQTLNPTQFAANHIEGPHRQALRAYLRERGLEGAFPKDPTLIQAQLKRIQVSFSKGIAILAKPEVLDSEVEMTLQDDGTTRVQFQDQITRVHGRS